MALAPVVEGVRLDLTALLESARAELHLAVAGVPPVCFSAKNLRSMVFNLLSNAVQYHAPNRPPVVHIRARAEAGRVLLAVQTVAWG